MFLFRIKYVYALLSKTSVDLFFCHNTAFCAEVIVAEEAVKAIVPVVRLGEHHVVCIRARLAGPRALPGHFGQNLCLRFEFLHCRPQPQFISTLAPSSDRLWHTLQFLFPCCAVCTHTTMSSVVPKKVVDLALEIEAHCCCCDHC